MESYYLNKKYIDITNLIQNEFERNVSKYGDKIKCKKGCSKCCSQIFKITFVDSIIIQKYLNSISTEEKNNLKAKAKKYLTEINSEHSKHNEYFSKPEIPCPALSENGECMIYEARPVICRRFGPPVYDYKNPGKIFACDLNFKEGEEIIDDELISNQTSIGKEWDKLKTEFNTLSDLSENSSTTIAEAIFNS
ncbi:MAG: YkgJ family cysteine cluster protein [Bacteroidota bacterium]|nr:YkgJ family cysteine cluster protein [Bacteroidota bacterium]